MITQPIRGRVMLVHAGALGDFILALPIIAALRTAGATGVTILGRPHIAILATLDQQADRILDFETGGYHALFSPDLPLPGRAVSDLAGHDLAINMAAPNHAAFADRLAAFTGGRVIDLDPRPRTDQELHITEQWLADLANAGFPVDSSTPTIRIPSQSQNTGIILHPGSGGRSKCWPLDRFSFLASDLLSTGRSPRFLVGPVERESWPAADIARLEAVAPLIQGGPLPEVAALLASAAHVVANDSGIAHLAAAVGTPLTAIFGPTEPRRWRPLGQNVSVVAARSWPDEAAVLATIERPPPRR